MVMELSDDGRNKEPPQHNKRDRVPTTSDVHVIRMFRPSKEKIPDQNDLTFDSTAQEEDGLNDPIIITTQPSNPEEENAPFDGIDDIMLFPPVRKDPQSTQEEIPEDNHLAIPGSVKEEEDFVKADRGDAEVVEL